MQEAGVVNLFRTLLILVGVMVLIRFIGRLMMAKRDLAEEQSLKAEDARKAAEREVVKKNYGRTRILGKTDKSKGNSNVEDVDYTEL